MTCQTSLAPNLRESIRCFSIINSHLNWCFQTNNKLTPGLKNTKSIYWPNTNKMTKSPLKILKAPRTSPSFPHGIYKNLFLIFLPLTLHLPPCNPLCSFSQPKTPMALQYFMLINLFLLCIGLQVYQGVGRVADCNGWTTSSQM